MEQNFAMRACCCAMLKLPQKLTERFALVEYPTHELAVLFVFCAAVRGGDALDVISEPSSSPVSSLLSSPKSMARSVESLDDPSLERPPSLSHEGRQGTSAVCGSVLSIRINHRGPKISLISFRGRGHNPRAQTRATICPA